MKETLSFSGYYDKHQIPINEGDIVRFYYDADYGYGDGKCNGKYTEIIDVCYKDKETELFYLMCNLGLGAFVYRHNDYCEVIGNVYKDTKKLKYFDKRYLKSLFPELNKTQP